MAFLYSNLLRPPGSHTPRTCLLADVRIPFAEETANKWRLEWISFWTQSAASLACSVLVSRGYKIPEGDQLIDSIDGLPPLTRSEIGPFLTLDQSEPTFEFITKPIRSLEHASAIALNTFDELEPKTLAALVSQFKNKILSVGPLLPQASLADTHQCMDWLDTQAATSVLYICFGTVYIQSQENLRALGRALEEAGQPFLWVVRPKSLPLDMSDPFPDDAFKERTRHFGKVVPWAPQMQVIAHPSVGDFLSHCGWNSILESLDSGVPLLGWPLYADQMLNTRCIIDTWHVGQGLDLELLRSNPECSYIKAKIDDVMRSSDTRQSAHEWAKASRTAIDAHVCSSTLDKRLLMKLLQPQDLS